MKCEPKIRFYPINKWFSGSHFHHFHLWNDTTLGAYIPKKVHRATYHNSKTYAGMDETNVRVYNWLAEKYGAEPLAQDKRITHRSMNLLIEKINEVEPKAKFVKRERGKAKLVDDGKIRIKVTFNDEEEEKIQALKDASGLGWHDFILVSVGAVKKKDLKKSKKQ